MVGALAVVILFIWGIEFTDFPHFLLGGPATPLNWREAIIESIFTITLCYVAVKYIHEYEKKWMNTLKEMERLAITDDLTGSLNRREFIARTTREFSRAARSARPFILILIDFDNFKGVNDTFGHLAGDAILRGFIGTVSRLVRQQDIVGRLGGDEFGITLVDANKEDATVISERIISEWAKVDVKSDDGQLIKISVSMGITSWETKDQTLTDLISRADKLLYQAKHKGRNRIEIG